MPAPARLLTAGQVCERFGVPSVRTVRTMRENGLVAVRLGKEYLYDEADVIRYIERNKTCHARTGDRASNGSKREDAITSSGMSAVQRSCVQLARQTSERLKRLSRNTSGEVIDMQARASRGK